MNSQETQKKFQAQQEEVLTLMEKNSRFKRIYDEYDHLQDNLWHLENTENVSITDDFLNYLKTQLSWLEAEIEEFLAQPASAHHS